MRERQNVLLALVIVVLFGYIVYDSFIRTPLAPTEPYTQFRSPKAKVQTVATYAIPENLNFAGEPVPVENPDIIERFDKEVHINTYYHSNTIIMMNRANRWFPIIEPILQKNGIPEDFKYLALIESSLDNVVSHKNAVGFWQLLGGTAKEWGLEVNNEVDERYHPVKSAEVASKYLKKAYRKFNNWTCVAASYNMGVAGLGRRMREQKVDTYYDLLLNHETSRYVFRALALKEIMENPKKYGYHIPEEHLYQDVPMKEIKITKSIKNLVDFSKAIGINYKTLKIYNPWLRKKQLTVRGRNKNYTIMVPTNVSDQLIAEYVGDKRYTTNNVADGEGQNGDNAAPKDLQSLNSQPN